MSRLVSFGFISARGVVPALPEMMRILSPGGAASNPGSRRAMGFWCSLAKERGPLGAQVANPVERPDLALAVSIFTWNFMRILLVFSVLRFSFGVSCYKSLR